MKANQLAEDIEIYVQSRNSGWACELIKRYLKARVPHSPEALFVACDWYRRLGLHEETLRILKLEERLSRPVSTRTFEGKRTLWAARALNLMGANAFAVELLRQLEPRSLEDHRILGTIYLANSEHALAALHLRKARNLDTHPESYRSRLFDINLADSLCGLDELDAALNLALEVERRSPEPLLRGIACLARGEYLARLRRFPEALAQFERARELFPSEDETPDFALLLKWHGYALASSGKVSEGTRMMDRAFGILRARGLGAQAWLDVLRLKSEAGILSHPETAALRRYPGLSEGFRKSLPEALSERTPQASWKIDLQTDEIFYPDGRIRLNVPGELKAVAFLRLSDCWGIRDVSFKCLLWPDQCNSYLSLQGRLKQMLFRIRNHHRIEVENRDGFLSLSPAALGSLGVTAPAANPVRPSFLKGRSRFNRREAQDYYGLSQTHAGIHVKTWESRGWISMKSSGRTSSYILID